MVESPGSRRGQHYVSASAGRLPSMGQHRLQVKTNEGRDSKVLYQFAEVSTPLTAVSGTCDAGNWVVYTSEGGFILNCNTGGRTYFERNGGIYELDHWIKEEELNVCPAGTLSSKARGGGSCFDLSNSYPIFRRACGCMCESYKPMGKEAR